jgi:tRNA-dihydrouridine synthase B
MGCEYCTAEMVLDRCVTMRSKRTPAILATSPGDHPVAGQLIGNDPAEMARAGTALCQRGFDVIDLNFACPVNKAMKRSRGGRIMNQPDLAIEIVRAVVAACDRPVTLKVRQKFLDEPGRGGEESFWQIAEGAYRAGAGGITVHARSVWQKYTGLADWGFLKRVKAAFPSWTVIGSGDVWTAHDALGMLGETGVDAVAVARGAIGNPWFFRQVRDIIAGHQPYQPDLTEQRRVMLAHAAGAVSLYGPDKGPRIMRKWGIKYARMHPHPKQLRMAFVATKTPQDLQAVIDRYYPKNT